MGSRDNNSQDKSFKSFRHLDMDKWFLDMSRKEFVSLVKKFNGYPRVLSPCPTAKLALQKLADRGADIMVLTSFGGCPIQTKFRQDYLKVVFGDIFSEIIVLELGTCKKAMLEQLLPDVFIEDNKQHAEKAIDLGIKTYLIRTTYNEGCDDAIYVDFLVEAIEDMYNDE